MFLQDKITRYIKQKLGIPVLDCGTSDDWDNYESEIAAAYPTYHKFEKVLDWVCDELYRIRRIVKDFIWEVRYRTINRYNVVNTDLKPAYYDKDIRMLHANFSLLVDYVENECAWLQEISESRHTKKKTWFWKPNEAQGLAYLQWASSLTYDEWCFANTSDKVGFYTPQALHAQEVVKLYLWWKYDYSCRCDLWDFYDDGDTEYSRYLLELEDKYSQEDEEMLIRLMKIRRGLWT